MFDALGQPTGGFGQYSPFKDSEKPAGQVPPPKAPDGVGSGTPSVPTDPTLSGWRFGAKRPLGGIHAGADPQQQSSLMGAIGSMGATASTSMGGVGSPLQNAIAGTGATGSMLGITDPGQQHPAVTPISNPKTDWQSFIHSNNINGADERNMMPQLVSQFNQLHGSHWIAGNPNAQGQSDTVGIPGMGYADVIHGGDNNNDQFMLEGQNQPQMYGGGFTGLGGSNPLSQTGSSNPLLAAILQNIRKPQGPVNG